MITQSTKNLVLSTFVNGPTLSKANNVRDIVEFMESDNEKLDLDEDVAHAEAIVSIENAIDFADGIDATDEELLLSLLFVSGG